MNNNTNGMSCQLGCWALGAGVGALTFILLLVLGDYGFIAAAFLAAVVFAILGALLSWLFCTELPKPGDVTPGPRDDGKPKTAAAAAPKAAPAPSAPAPAPAPAPASAPSAAPAAAAGTTDADTAKSGADDAGQASASNDAAQASTLLSGEEELAGRKGEWTYNGGSESGGSDGGEPRSAANDGAGTRPESLSEARGGQPDDLKKIKGIGPKLEQLCHSLGFYHFDQIASWGADEVAWVDQNLEGFKGRVTRDDWVEQAKLLATGGETEFSKKVDKGDVY